MAQWLDATRRSRFAALAGRLSRPLGSLLSLALLIVVVRQARTADWSLLFDPRLSAGFWIALALYYLLSPLSELLVYSSLWGFDRRAFPALLRKFVSNELLFDYLGDVQFLAWAQARSGPTAFGAVKDVTILSALSGNLVTLVQIAIAWPLVSQGLAGVPLETIFLSLSVIVVISSLILLLGKRIFSHRPSTLLWIGTVLALRSVIAMALAAVMWALIMPEVSLASLFVLATLRMMVSRLPLIPSKDLLFAGLAVVVFGKSADVSAATSMIASLVLGLHLVAGSLLAIAHFVTRSSEPQRPATTQKQEQ